MASAKKLVVVYHSVGDGVPGSFPITLERLKAQLALAVGKGWVWGDVRDIREPVSQKTLYVTHDDCTRDFVSPSVDSVLRSHSILPHYAVISGVFEPQPIYPVTHLVQAALASPLSLKAQEIRRLCANAKDALEMAEKIYEYETDIDRRCLKAACNLVLNDAGARRLISSHLRLDVRAGLSSRFALNDYGSVGVHGRMHRAFDGDCMEYLETEIMPCWDWLCCNVRQERISRVYTLPMRPRPGVTLDKLCAMLKQLGFVGMFDGPGEWDGESFIIPRVDAKKLEEHL